MSKQTESAYAFGRSHADLYIGFCCFIFSQARALGVDQVFFCTREGEFLKALYDSLFCGSAFSQTAPRAELLEISRLAAFGPSLGQVNTESLMRLWNQYSSQSPGALMKSLGVDYSTVREHFSAVGLEAGTTVKSPWRDDRFRSVLDGPGFCQIVDASLSRKRELARQFLDARFGSSPVIAIVDIGWRGSTQDSLANLYPDKHWHAFYLGLARYFNDQPANITKVAFGPNSNVSMDDFSLLHAVDVIEMLTNSSNGSVIGYELTADGTITAVRRNDPSEDKAFLQFTGEFQRGVLDKAADQEVDDLMQRYVKGELRQSTLEAWHDILNQPCDELVSTYFHLNHNEEFGTGEFKNKAHAPSASQILFSPFKRGGFAQLKRYATYNQWTKGLAQRKDLTTLNRLILVSLVRSGLVYKWIKARIGLKPKTLD